MRLQKFLAQAGVASRRKAEEMITAGRVSVNGQVMRVLGTTVSGEDVVKVDGKNFEAEQIYYFLFNKPARTVTTVSDDRGRKTVSDFFHDIPARLFPVGRLDYNTTGALVMTNDGDLAYLMTHPSTNLDKTYQVEIAEDFDQKHIADFRNGILLEEGLTAPATLIVRDANHLSVTIHEGKNREVRRMFETLGYNVKSLHRSNIGFLSIQSVPLGKYRPLTLDEVEKMKTMCRLRKLENPYHKK
ncbi:MAG: pseudouridine synthase [Firmicutes bacterium]|nr:pseudouridine synthase [Bacillota bacterium]